MARISASLKRGQIKGPFDQFYRFAEQKIERAALKAADRGARIGTLAIRTEMAGAGLGRLGQAIGNTSDLAKGRGVHRYAGGGFSASGVVFVRSKSERTRGAIESYTKGAEIRPVRSRWLWIPSDDIKRVVGSGAARRRLTPALWRPMGMEAKLGPLVRARAADGTPLLIVKNVGVSLAGKKHSAKSLKRNGQPRAGQVAKEFIVAFIGIPRTSRAARVDVPAQLRKVQAQLPELFNQEFARN